MGIDLGRAAIVWLFNWGVGVAAWTPARLLLRPHVLMQHATAVQFILMSEMENSRAALNPTERLALARLEICNNLWHTWWKMAHRRYGCALIWPRPSPPALPHWHRDGCDVNIHTGWSGRRLAAANQAGAPLQLRVRRHELLSAMALTYFYRFHFLEVVQREVVLK